MDIFIKNGNRLDMASLENSYGKLPVGTYVLNLDRDTKQFFLEETESLTVPKKLYGNFDIVKKWVRTYEDRTGNLGVLLSGIKGSGKTITAKLLANSANKPIIIIKEPFIGLSLKLFLSDRRLGDCVILIDEFEKIYESEIQTNFLDILDGTSSTHHLFIFTVNNECIDDKLINRPSRIFYRKRYKSLPDDAINEITDDMLNNKSRKEELLDAIEDIDELSYDILISIIDEINRYEISANEAIDDMCLDKKIRLFYPFECVELKGKKYYIINDGTRGLPMSEKAFLKLRALTSNKPIEMMNEYNNLRFDFNGKFTEEETNMLARLDQKRVYAVSDDFKKINKSIYETKMFEYEIPFKFVFVESNQEMFLDAGAVYTEDEFKKNFIIEDNDGNMKVPKRELELITSEPW